MTIKIQSTFSGYGGGACTLFSLYDTDTNVLAIGVQAEFRKERRKDCIVITNDPDIDRDRLFTDDDIKAAISAFYALQQGVASNGKGSRLGFSETAARSNPTSSIEKDGIDVNGPRYRISENVTCGQMAALATCLHAIKAGKVDQMLGMADELSMLMMGGDSNKNDMDDEVERFRRGEVISI
ncbi:hypothetical protein [Nitrosomonas marina]|uniref:Uncharacterized protein n=1 Tax=Nitrosomonas marina TaxID=917 RepID=A0A1H8IUE6_9PROT|nr:hypothetical protein [Nitrosomonas marina]SEN72092.1 hypothetical protein SAMN05216325_1416 [Nitrosomonas marina]